MTSHLLVALRLTRWSRAARCVRALEGGGNGRRRVETVILPDGEQFKTLNQVTISLNLVMPATADTRQP